MVFQWLSNLRLKEDCAFNYVHNIPSRLCGHFSVGGCGAYHC